MFNFELIIYEETEFFRDQGKQYNFNYPYSEMKNNINMYKTHLGKTDYKEDRVYIQRSVVCLQEFFMDQINLPGQMIESFEL